MSSQQGARSGLSFFGTIGAVMAALKLKQSWDEYKSVSTEEEGRVAMTSADSYRDGGDDESTVGLLDTEIRPTRPKKKSGCCVCCGLNCGLFWKAFGIVVAGLVLWNAIKLIIWAVKPAPTGLEHMPAFSSSLGCLNAPHIYNSSKTVFTARMHPTKFDHAFDIRGGAVGTFVIAEGPAGSDEMKYEMTLRTDDADLLKYVDVHFPDTDEDDHISNSRLLITTPRPDASSSSCMRYDIKLFVPPTLKKLHVASHTTMHVEFDANADVKLDDLFVTMFSMSKDNMILPHQGVRGTHMALEVYRGWIVGDVAIVNSTAITTQRGDGITNVRAHPAAPVNPAVPDPASLRTTTGAGRTDIFYVTPKAFKRPINNIHMSSRNADMYLTYRQAEFSGRIELDSKSYTATGAQPYPKTQPSGDDDVGIPVWTHWVGDKDGADEVYVKSRGWTGLYF
ncbi:hypothetical protein Hypma_002683 [Hypsizygus marmoreus]|uniref:Uncharacterized protein n=1 Tax=Hypsizygus marmoreus TaxID=39966 RepID=A0A369J3Q0_HYPMA|nr:hypothetical protein Hypma_002683 [Hypsizygus marmoreus]